MSENQDDTENQISVFAERQKAKPTWNRADRIVRVASVQEGVFTCSIDSPAGFVPGFAQRHLCAFSFTALNGSFQRTLQPFRSRHSLLADNSKCLGSHRKKHEGARKIRGRFRDDDCVVGPPAKVNHTNTPTIREFRMPEGLLGIR